MCSEPLSPAYHGTECIHKGCLTVSSEDPMWCEMCAEGYLMDFETSKCYKTECPEGYFEVPTEFGFSYCFENCEDYELFDEEYLTCLDCSWYYEGCTSCMREDDNVFCESCEEGLHAANNGVGCTPCQENQFYYKDVCIDCASNFPHCKSCIQYPYLDWASEQCLDCYGSIPLTPTPEGGVCECAADEFIMYDVKDSDSASC